MKVTLYTSYTIKSRLVAVITAIVLITWCLNAAAQSSGVQSSLGINADWISCPEVNLQAYGVYHLRKTFGLPDKPRQFIIYVSGDQRYRLFVNGVPVCFGPARGDLRNWNYETIDVAPYLKAGKNVLAAQVWNMGSGAPAAQVTAQTGFFLQGSSAADSMVNTNKSWRVIRNESYFPEPFPSSRLASYIVGSCDSVNFEKYPLGWQNADYNDENWLVPVSEAKERYYIDKRTLKPRSIPMMEEKIEPVTGIVRVSGLDSAVLSAAFDANGSLFVPAHTSSTVLFDRKTLTTAYPEITFSGGRNSKIKVTYAESLFDSKRLKGNRNEVNGKNIYGYYDVFLPDGGNQHVFRPLWMRTFRYIQFDITTADEPVTINKLLSVYTAYPFKENAVFSSNDKSLSDIWNVGWRTARLCASETYMDCPYYEQLQYVGDTRIQALISLYVSGDDRLMRNAIEQFHQSQIPDGLTMDAYPARGGKFIPPFSLFWIAMLHDYAWYREDRTFTGRYLVPMEAILKWFEYRLDEHSGMLGKLGYWNFVDWSFAYKGIPPGGLDGNSAILSLQFVYALNQAADLFTLFGQTQKAVYYRQLATKINNAVRLRCYDKSKMLLADSPEKTSFSQHANIWAILTDCVPPPQQRSLMEKVINDSLLIQTSLYYRFYYTRALRKAGLGNLYLASLQPWKDMLALGLSTFPETLAANVRSDCHAWSASPCYDLLATVCGVDTEKPGFASVSIEPHPGDLTEVYGIIPHPRGTIKVHYKKMSDGSYSADIELPIGVQGHFILKNKKELLKGGHQVIRFRM